MQKQSRSNGKPIMQSPGSSSRNIHKNIWVLLLELRPLPRWGMKTSSWAGDSWQPLISPPNNQKKVTHSATLTPNFTYKTSPPNHEGVQVFWTRATGLLSWPSNKVFSAPNANVSGCLYSLCIRHMNLCSGTLQVKKVSGLPWWSSAWESTCQCRARGSDP